MSIIRLTIDESGEYEEVEVIIKCSLIDKKLSRLIDHIRQYEITLIGKRKERLYSISAEELYYIESVDNKTFLYDEKEVYESDLKLYELEKLVLESLFIRISKNLIVNTFHIESVRALFNGRFEASLKNGEKVIVNRHYARSFKEKFLT